jgi:hypothetical protein
MCYRTTPLVSRRRVSSSRLESQRHTRAFRQSQLVYQKWFASNRQSNDWLKHRLISAVRSSLRQPPGRVRPTAWPHPHRGPAVPASVGHGPPMTRLAQFPTLLRTAEIRTCGAFRGRTVGRLSRSIATPRTSTGNHIWRARSLQGSRNAARGCCSSATPSYGISTRDQHPCRGSFSTVTRHFEGISPSTSLSIRFRIAPHQQARPTRGSNPGLE